MDLFGIGPFELILVFILIILVFGPEDLSRTGKKTGRFLSQMMKTDTWKAIRSISQEIRTLPNKLAREAEIESYLAENPQKKNPPTTPVKNIIPTLIETPPFETDLKAWTTPPTLQKTEEEK
jgi:Sec-independent protein translocase protein TatA